MCYTCVRENLIVKRLINILSIVIFSQTLSTTNLNDAFNSVYFKLRARLRYMHQYFEYNERNVTSANLFTIKLQIVQNRHNSSHIDWRTVSESPHQKFPTAPRRLPYQKEPSEL